MTTPAFPLIAYPRCRWPDPLHRGIALEFREQFFPLGVPIEVQSNRETVLAAASLSFGRYGECPSGKPAELLIQLCVDPERHDEKPLAVPCYRALSHLFHIGCSEASFAIADLARGSAVGFVSPEIANDTSFFCYVFLECLFHVLTVHRNHTPVHCSCVALSDCGVLICGASGTGKTTLAYACLKAGMQIVSDDVVHLRLDPVRHELKLWGNPWTLRLLPDAVQIFPELNGTDVKRRGGQEKCLEIDVSRQFPGSASISCRPAALVFLQRHDAGHRLRPIEKEVALQRLFRDVVLDEDAVMVRHQTVLQELVTTGTYELSYAGSPFDAAESIKSLL